MTHAELENSTGMKSAPELHPTWEDFVHPIKYLSKPEIVQLGEKYGILKVIPPEGWKPRFALDSDTFKFHTRIQRLHELNLRNRSRACFVEGFNCYIQGRGEEPMSVIDDLCSGVSNEYAKGLSEEDLQERLNGWLLLKNGEKAHVHDIFISRELRKWFYKVRDEDKGLLKLLSAYCKYLVNALHLEDSDKESGLESGSGTETQERNTLLKLCKSPAALLAQPQNLKQLQRMKGRMSSTRQKLTHGGSGGGGSAQVKRRKLEQNNYLTPPMDSSETFTTYFTPEQQKEWSDDGKSLLTPEIITPEQLDETCTVCFSSHSPETTLICDGCSRAFHMKCLPVPLERVPKYDWFCTGCLMGSTSMYAEYGFEEEFENMFTLREFERYCTRWTRDLCRYLRKEKRYVQVGIPREEIEEGATLSEESLEKLFWAFTNDVIDLPRGEEMKIRYGADINSKNPGEASGFPNAGCCQPGDEEYVNSEWNLTKLPFARGSLLNYVCQSLGSGNTDSEQISGMSTPWLYVGGPLSTFCWHKEDHYTLSANYSHKGAPKKWYGLPSTSSETFEELIRRVAPEYEAKQKDLMHQLVSMISPQELSDAGVEVFETVQRPGEFIVTFPKVYHAGFNYGYNVNEAVNFTLPLWVPYSVGAVADYAKVGKECVFDTFSLLRRVWEDLQGLNGDGSYTGHIKDRRQWIEDTGVSEDVIDNILEWVHSQYSAEVAKFDGYYKDAAFSDILGKLPRLNTSEMVKSPILNEEIEVEDRVCGDCRTRVHFGWIMVDMYEDAMTQLKDVAAKLEVKMEDIPKEEKKEETDSVYADRESEWKAIIQEAASTDTGANANAQSESRRLRRRKRPSAEVEENCNISASVGAAAEEEFKERMGTYEALRVLRAENPQFGQTVLCLECYRSELCALKERDTDCRRVVNVSRVVCEQ